MKRTKRETAATTAARHIALLRGINVGRAKRVEMAKLRELFTDLGYSNVSTLLNSGNVVFTAPHATDESAEARIEKAILAMFGFSARVTVLSAAEFAEVLIENPLRQIAKDPSRSFVTVLNKPDRVKLVPLAQQHWDPDVLAIGTRVAYLWCPEGMLASRLVEAVSRVLGDAATTRNWATMTKLQALVDKQR